MRARCHLATKLEIEMPNCMSARMLSRKSDDSCRARLRAASTRQRSVFDPFSCSLLPAAERGHCEKLPTSTFTCIRKLGEKLRTISPRFHRVGLCQEPRHHFLQWCGTRVGGMQVPFTQQHLLHKDTILLPTPACFSCCNSCFLLFVMVTFLHVLLLPCFFVCSDRHSLTMFKICTVLMVYHCGKNNYSFDALQAYCFGIKKM